MSSKNAYTVMRSHEGDKFYREGDTRELSAADAKHLVELGVLVKAEPAPKNKAAPAAKNKAS